MRYIVGGHFFVQARGSHVSSNTHIMILHLERREIARTLCHHVYLVYIMPFWT